MLWDSAPRRAPSFQVETVTDQVLDSMLLNEYRGNKAEISTQQNQIRGLERQIEAEHQMNLALQERLTKLEPALARPLRTGRNDNSEYRPLVFSAVYASLAPFSRRNFFGPRRPGHQERR